MAVAFPILADERMDGRDVLEAMATADDPEAFWWALTEAEREAALYGARPVRSSVSHTVAPR
jgi:hypothetical protein